MQEAISLPQPGRQYPLALGSSILDNPAEFCTLRYDFKPASAGRVGDGQVAIDGSEVSLALPHSNAGQPPLQFKGYFEHSKDSMDCVLLFDGENFKLEALAGHVHNLRYLRGSQRGAHGPTQPANATSAASAGPAAVASVAPAPAASQEQQWQQHSANGVSAAAAAANLRAQPSQGQAHASSRAQSADLPAQPPAAAGASRPGASGQVPMDVDAAVPMGVSLQQQQQQQQAALASSSSSGSDTDSGGPVIGNLGSGSAVRQRHPPPAAGAVSSAPQAAAHPSRPEDLDASEAAFFGYIVGEPAAGAQGADVLGRPGGGGGGDSSSGSSSSSGSDVDDEDLNRCSDDDSDGGGGAELI